MMSAHRPEKMRAALKALLLAGTAALAVAQPAVAQDVNELRGAVAENAGNYGLLVRTRPEARNGRTNRDAEQEDGIPAPRYRPASAGPVSDEGTTAAAADRTTIFRDGAVDREDAENAGAEPIERTRPSTARQRAEEARQRAGRPSPTTAERRAAQRAEMLENPQEDETTTGTVRVGSVDSEVDLTIDPGAERVESIEGIEKEPEENPYSPLGLRLGSFTVRPSLETGVTWTSNANSSASGAAAFLSETTLRLNAVSDWSVHRATLDAYGTFRKSISGANVRETEAGISGSLELDLGHEFRALASLGYAIRPESASSPALLTGTLSRPTRQTLTGSAGVEKDAGKFRFAVTGDVERDWYGDADLSTGGSVSQRDRNATLSTVTLRGGYAISPAITPFVEAEMGRRTYDLRLDGNGYQRSATRVGARAGVGIDLGEKLTGEVSAGWISEKPDDSRLAAISGATVDASINWSPMRGTVVGLTGTTTVEAATTAGESGSLLHSGRLSVQRELRANLTGSVALGAALRDYAGSNGRDFTWSAEASLTYWLNRHAGITGRARHEAQNSNLPDRDYRTNSLFLGLKLQR